MKANRIPVEIRIQRRINGLEPKVRLVEPIGGGNPYYRCFYCKRPEPEISYDGHYKGCPEPGLRKQIDYYKLLLDAKKLEA